MTLVSFGGNDCLVGVKNGQLFITGMYRCCHGNIIDQATIWLPLELKDKLGLIKNFDEVESNSRMNLN